MKHGEIYEKTEEELREKIDSLNEEVIQWMNDYEELKTELDELNDKLIEKDAREERYTKCLLDVLNTIENMLSLPGHVYTDAQLLNIRDGIKAHLNG